MVLSDPSFDAEPSTALVRVPPLSLVKQVLRGEREPVDWAETRNVLAELARRKCGGVLAALLVEQVLKVTEGTDWPSRRAAMDALLRRVGFASRDDLTIAERPGKGAVLGRYGLAGSAAPKQSKGRKRMALRPYRTELYSVEPLRVSCDCADFLSSSLGVCKHALAVLEDLGATPRKWAAALRPPASEPRSLPHLSWDPSQQYRRRPSSRCPRRLCAPHTRARPGHGHEVGPGGDVEAAAGAVAHRRVILNDWVE